MQFVASKLAGNRSFGVHKTIADNAFAGIEFQNYAKSMDINFKSDRPGRHSRNAIESKHRIIWNVFEWLKTANNNQLVIKVLVYKSISLSNDLYGNDK